MTLLRAHGHDRDGCELRAHVVRDLLGRDGIGEEAQAQSVPFASVATAFDRIQRVGAENRQRRHLVELDGLHRPLQLTANETGAFCTTASFRARRVPVSSGFSSEMLRVGPSSSASWRPRRRGASPGNAAPACRSAPDRRSARGSAGAGISRVSPVGSSSAARPRARSSWAAQPCLTAFGPRDRLRGCGRRCRSRRSRCGARRRLS